MGSHKREKWTKFKVKRINQKNTSYGKHKAKHQG